MWLCNLRHDNLVANWTLKIGVLLKVKKVWKKHSVLSNYVGIFSRMLRVIFANAIYFQMLTEILMCLSKRKFIFENIIKVFPIWYGSVPKCALIISVHLNKGICQKDKQTWLLRQLFLVQREMKLLISQALFLWVWRILGSLGGYWLNVRGRQKSLSRLHGFKILILIEA